MVSSLSGSSMLLTPSLGLGQATTAANNTSTASTSKAVASPVYNANISNDMIMQLVGKMLEMMMMLLTQKLGSNADAVPTTYNTNTSSTSTSTADSTKYDPDAAGYAAASKTTVAPYGYSASIADTNKTVAAAAPVLSVPKAIVASPAPAPVAVPVATTAAPKAQSNEELAKILGRA